MSVIADLIIPFRIQELSHMAAILQFQQRPGLLSAYKNIFMPGRAAYQGIEALPKLEAQWNKAVDPAARIQQYRDVCGFENDGTFPILYPHVLTFAMHIHLLADKRFPAKAFGAVHARSHMLQRRAISETEPVDLKCFFSDARILKAGLEVDVTTLVSSGGSVIWESVNSYLFRGKKFGEIGDAHPWSAFSELGEEAFTASWHVPKKMGRTYARITGDFNPIHISRIMAKLFGFKRDIIHGMWSLARCLTALPGPAIEGPQRLDVAFKGPVFMDSSCTLKGTDQDGARRFDLFCGKNPRPTIVAQLAPCSETDTLLTQKS